MAFVTVSIDDGIATPRLARGKVNALNGAVVDELRSAFQATQDDAEVGAVILTGEGSFFSFGFDIPAFLSFTQESFTEYLTGFSEGITVRDSLIFDYQVAGKAEARGKILRRVFLS